MLKQASRNSGINTMGTRKKSRFSFSLTVFLQSTSAIASLALFFLYEYKTVTWQCAWWGSLRWRAQQGAQGRSWLWRWAEVCVCSFGWRWNCEVSPRNLIFKVHKQFALAFHLSWGLCSSSADRPPLCFFC